MLLRSLPHLHYPITVTGLLFKNDDHVPKNAPIFTYSYKGKVTEYASDGQATEVEKTFPTRYESQVEGTIKRWRIGKGTVIVRHGTELVEINEPCQHSIQFGGLCADCGKDMAQVDYGTAVPDHARANFGVAHSTDALKISKEEAQKTENAAKKRLLAQKKLSLVVDLDQTIIHAAVDPTIGEWMADEDNPNHDAVKDVRKFQLDEEGPGHNCWYYVKMRPGLEGFLEHISELYELHVYTMGTRAYAKQIAKIVDPDRKFFSDRILSRDENGGMNVKSLERIFPVDTSMVVIIDDRSDVWNWSKCLIKVVPYDFFKGIGDINSSFLPKRLDDVPDVSKPTSAASESASEEAEQQNSSTEEAIAAEVSAPDSDLGPGAESAESSTIDKLLSMAGATDAAAMQEKSHEQDEQLAAQIASQPLLQQQQQLEHDEEEANNHANGENDENHAESRAPRPRHNLLKDDDDELENLDRALSNIHRAFYDAHAKSVKGTMSGGRIAELKGEKSPKKRPGIDDLALVPDVRVIIPEMKSVVLKGCSIIFSGVFPIGLRPEHQEIWRQGEIFGAQMGTEVTKSTTHIIGTHERFTKKMSLSLRRPGIKLVTSEWIRKACKEWRRPDESLFSIPPEYNKKRKRGSDEQLRATNEDEDTDQPEEDLEADEPTRDDGGNEEVADHDGDVSPIDDVEDDDWDKMAKEFDDEEESEPDSETTSQAGSQAGDEGKKRKRDLDSDNESQAGNESDTSTKTGSGRKRRELGRTSSLNNVSTLGTATKDGTSDRDAASVTQASPTNGHKAEEEEESDFEDFEAELERALAEGEAEEAVAAD